jgi:hypothetical protein
MAMASRRRLYFLALDGGDDDEHIFSLDVESDWNLSRLRETLERRYSPFRGEPLDRIKVWVLQRYLGAHIPDPSNLNTTIPAYNDVPLTKVEAMTTILSYFQQPFMPGEESKIHLILKLGMDFVSATS